LEKDRDFIFPMNYKNKEKFLGIIDYRTLGVILLFSLAVFFILKNIEIELVFRVSIFIMVVGFFSILILVGINGENMLDFLYFILKYAVNEKVYVYRKSEERGNLCENLLKRGLK